jgi:hypothetical protein
MGEPGRPLKYKTVGELQAAIEDYFETDAYMGEGDNRMFAPTMSGLAYHLDLSRQGLLDYDGRDGFLDTIKRARNRVAVALEQRLYGNNVTGIIFNLKNNFEWKDKQEVETKDTTNDVSDEDLNAKIVELMEKLK